MFKVFFAPAWGQSSEQMVEVYKLQAPNNLPKWEDMETTFNVYEANYLVIQDYTTSPEIVDLFDPSKIYYFGRETPGLGPIDNYDGKANVFSWRNGSGYLYTKWHYPKGFAGLGENRTYDDLHNQQVPPLKTRNISCIQSNKRSVEGHVKRLAFLQEFMRRCPDKLDLYGSNEFSNSILEDDNKYNALNSYKYNIAFDNGSYKDYFATQFTDAILSWCIPVYWGCPNISKYFPEKSYIEIDIENHNEIDRIVDLIENDDYESRIDDLTKARNLILNKYNLWPTIYNSIKGIK